MEEQYRLYNLQLDCKAIFMNDNFSNYYNFFDLFAEKLELNYLERFRIFYDDVGEPEKNHRVLSVFIQGGGHVVLHHYLEINEMYFDFLLSTPFDVEVVKEIINDCFSPESISINQFARQA